MMVHTVGMADMKLSADPEDRIVTHALGSCLGIGVYDSKAGVGAMAHIMMPMSSINPARAQENPFAFVDTGIPAMFRACYRLGAQKERMVVKVAGGARILDEEGRFKIGERNYTVLRKILWKNGVLIESEDVGGSISRTMALEVGTGRVTVRSNGEVREL